MAESKVVQFATYLEANQQSAEPSPAECLRLVKAFLRIAGALRRAEILAMVESAAEANMSGDRPAAT